MERAAKCSQRGLWETKKTISSVARLTWETPRLWRGSRTGRGSPRLQGVSSLLPFLLLESPLPLVSSRLQGLDTFTVRTACLQ